MNAIYLWGLKTAAAALLIALMEHMLPEGVIKREAKIGLGLLMVSAFLQPVLDLFA